MWSQAYENKLAHKHVGIKSKVKLISHNSKKVKFTIIICIFLESHPFFFLQFNGTTHGLSSFCVFLIL